ncbi:MAG: VOC family protein [Calditrichaeota bacterium]|nr:VOC family protein [Calditrichota bacterium]
MLKQAQAFSSFSVDNLELAKKFYQDTLGLKVKAEAEMGLNLELLDGMRVFIYPKENHQPATFTVLNFIVDNIEQTVSLLNKKGVSFEKIKFPGGPETDNLGIMRGKSAGMGPDIAWFKDPAGNFIAVMEN